MKSISALLILAFSSQQGLCMLGDYRLALKSELQPHMIPDWAHQIPAFRYILDNLYQKYEDVLELTNRKGVQKSPHDLITHMFGPSGMTPLTIHLHEKLANPDPLHPNVWSFVRTGEDKQRFQKEIEEILVSLRSFQAYNPSTDENNPTAAVLADLLNVYSKKDSIFKQYPLHATTLLLPMSHFILAAANLESDRFAQKKLLCQVRGIWDSYEKLAIDYRLNNVEVYTWPDGLVYNTVKARAHQVPVVTAKCDTVKSCPNHSRVWNTSAERFLVENQEFSLTGYGPLRRSSHLSNVYWSMDHCSLKEAAHFTSWMEDHYQNNKYHGFLCIVDSQLPKELVTHSREGEFYVSNTVKDYFGALRYLTETSFKKMVNSLDPQKSHLSDCHLSPTGSIDVTVVRAEINKAKGPFDKWEEESTLPDPYVKVSVDDVEIGRTGVKHNTLNPTWMETFHADKVYSWSDIKLEVFDKDGKVVGDKDDSLGGLDIELHNVVGNKDHFVSTRQQFSFGRLTAAIKYMPSTR